MESKFIELHIVNRAKSDRYESPISVNIHHIIEFENHAITDSDGKGCNVAESYDEIKQLIKDSGILIHKADPRLDTAHPLTYDEMLSMPGQPVWHSNTDQWALIAEEPQYADRITVRHADGTYSNISREDTVAKPWYRMKQQTLIDALREVRGDND